MKIVKIIKKWFGVVSDADRQRVELKRVSEVFGTLERMQRVGLLEWMERERRLFIAEPLARVQLRNRESWDAFMENVMMWALYKRQSEAWEGAMIKAEGEAVRKAQMENGKWKMKKGRSRKLTDAEVAMIRQSARDAVSEGAVAVPKVAGFEVFVVGSQPSADAEGTGAASTPNTEHLTPRVIAVGRYDAERGVTDMVMWSEIEGMMKKE